ncbi:MAG: c-type cytochrome [Gemmatimonadaceae bacterium]
MRPDPLRRIGVAILVAILVSGCEWFSDFKEQPKIKPWQPKKFVHGDTLGLPDTFAMRGNTPYSVPTTGMAVAGYQVSYQALPGTIDSMSAIPNPRAVSERSLDNGRKYYQINCAVCHGASGSGAGAAVKYGVPAPNLLTPITVARTDGYIFGMIRNGRGLMPTYDRIEESDRWDVVNYLRALQGKLAARPDTSPAGSPGQNGTAVPAATESAPTRPSVYRPRELRVNEMRGTAINPDSIRARRPPVVPPQGGEARP